MRYPFADKYFLPRCVATHASTFGRGDGARCTCRNGIRGRQSPNRQVVGNTQHLTSATHHLTSCPDRQGVEKYLHHQQSPRLTLSLKSTYRPPTKQDPTASFPRRRGFKGTQRRTQRRPHGQPHPPKLHVELPPATRTRSRAAHNSYDKETFKTFDARSRQEREMILASNPPPRAATTPGLRLEPRRDRSGSGQL